MGVKGLGAELSVDHEATGEIQEELAASRIGGLVGDRLKLGDRAVGALDDFPHPVHDAAIHVHAVRQLNAGHRIDVPRQHVALTVQPVRLHVALVVGGSEPQVVAVAVPPCCTPLVVMCIEQIQAR